MFVNGDGYVRRDSILLSINAPLLALNHRASAMPASNRTDRAVDFADAGAALMNSFAVELMIDLASRHLVVRFTT
jgi:hypothetical protein